MYLHIGKDIIVDSKNIVGIFNIEYIGNTKEYKNLCKRLEGENKIVRISENKEKSLIITRDKNKELAYFTNIGVYTIAKRLI